MEGVFLGCAEPEKAKKKIMKKCRGRMASELGNNGYGTLWGWGWENEETTTSTACAFQNQPICRNLA